MLATTSQRIQPKGNNGWFTWHQKADFLDVCPTLFITAGKHIKNTSVQDTHVDRATLKEHAFTLQCSVFHSDYKIQHSTMLIHLVVWFVLLLLLVNDELWLLLGWLKDHAGWSVFLGFNRSIGKNKTVLIQLIAEIWESRDKA